MADLKVGIDGRQAKPEAEAIRQSLLAISQAAKIATGDVAGLARGASTGMSDIRKAATSAGASVREFAKAVDAGGKGSVVALAKARLATDDLRASIERVRRSGAPVPDSWTRSLSAYERAIESTTQKLGRMRSAQEAAARTAGDAARAAGGLGGGINTLSDVAGMANPRLEKLALNAGLVFGAVEVARMGVGRLVTELERLSVAVGFGGKQVEWLKGIIARFDTGALFMALRAVSEIYEKINGGQFAGVTGGSSSMSGSKLAWADMTKELAELNIQTDAYLMRMKALENRGLLTNEVLQANAATADSLKTKFATLGQVGPAALNRFLTPAKEVKKALEDILKIKLPESPEQYAKRINNAFAMATAAPSVIEVPLAIRLDQEAADEMVSDGKERIAELLEEQKKFRDGWRDYVAEPGIAAWEETKAAGMDALADLIMGYKVDFKSLFENILRMWVRTLIEMVARAQAAQMAINVSGSATGGGGGGGGGGAGFLGGMKAMYAGVKTAFTGAYAAAAWAAVFVAVVAVILNQAKTSGRAEVDTAIKLGGAGGMSVDLSNSRYNSQGGRGRFSAQVKAVEAMLEEAKKFITGIGGAISTFSTEVEMVVGREGQGKKTNWFVKYADGLVKHFGKDSEAAFEFAMVQAIRNAPVIGLDPIVKRAIQQSTAEKMAKLQEEIQLAQMVANLGRDQMAVDIRQASINFDELRQKITALLGPSAELTQALANIQKAEVDYWMSTRDQITGRQKTKEEELADLRARGELWNAEKALRLASLQAEMADKRARQQLLAADIVLIRAEFEAQRARFTGRKATMDAEFDLDKQYNALQLAALQAQFDALGIAADALQAVYDALAKLEDIDIGSLQLPGASGGGGKGPKPLDPVRDALKAAGRTGWGPIQSAVADINDKWNEHAKAAKGNADLLDRIAKARRKEVDEILRQERQSLRHDVANFTGKGGDLGAALRSIGLEANDLVARAQDLQKAGGMTREEFAKLRAEIEAAAKDKREYLVQDAANSMFSQLYGLLGMEKENAELEYNLTVASLEIKYKELEIAVAKFQMEAAFLPALRALIDKVIAGGPGLFMPSTGGSVGGGGFDNGVRQDDTRRVWEDLTKRWQAATLRLVDALKNLNLSELSPLTPEQRFAEARSQYERTLTAANAGDLSAREDLAGLMESYLSEAETFYGRSTENYVSLFARIQREVLGVVGNTSMRDDNGVVWDARLGGAEIMQPVIDAIARSGLAQATATQGIFQQSMTQSSLLGQVVQQLAVMNARLQRAEAQRLAA